MRPRYPAETTNFYRPPEVALRPKHPKCKNEKRKTNSFFVYLTSLLKTKNEKGISFSFFVRKFENETGKNGIYTDLRCTDNCIGRVDMKEGTTFTNTGPVTVTNHPGVATASGFLKLDLRISVYGIFKNTFYSIV